MPDSSLAFDSITALAAKIRAGAISPVALTKALLDRIAALDGRLHAFIAVTRERALAEAQAAELAPPGRPGSGTAPRHPLRREGPLRRPRRRDYGGHAPSRGQRGPRGLRRRAAAGRRRHGRSLGKTYTVQFAFGGVGINHDQGTPHNPWHATPHAPGGSSSGSARGGRGRARSHGARERHRRLGPAPGRPLRDGRPQDHRRAREPGRRLSRSAGPSTPSGPLTRTVEDAALVYQAIQGSDPRDETTAGVPPHDALARLGAGVRGLRLALPETLFFDEVDPEVERAVREAGRGLPVARRPCRSLEVPEAAEAMAEQKRAARHRGRGLRRTTPGSSTSTSTSSTRWSPTG